MKLISSDDFKEHAFHFRPLLASVLVYHYVDIIVKNQIGISKLKCQIDTIGNSICHQQEKIRLYEHKHRCFEIIRTLGSLLWYNWQMCIFEGQKAQSANTAFSVLKQLIRVSLIVPS